MLACSCSSSKETPTAFTPAAVPVYAAKPRVEDVPLYIEALGHLKPSSHIQVRSRVDGVLHAVHAKEGEWVEAGDLLFEIESKPHQNKVDECMAEVSKSLAARKAAKNRHERFYTLAEKKLISQNEWDQIVTDLEQARADVALAKVRLNDAKLNLEYCQVVAHRAGRVGKVDVHPGQLISYGQELPLVELAAMNPLIVEFTLVEQDFVALPAELKKFEIRLLAAPDEVYPATLSFSDNNFDVKTGQIVLRAHVENPEFLLRPGMSVKVNLPVGMHSQAVVVPQKAVKYNDFGAYVFLVQPDNTVAMKQLELIGEFGADILVREGLTLDDVVITEGHQKVAPGATVEIKS
jgi:multidrug efflux system membrane fusion protein